jgi:hypothetical protein
MAGVGVDVNVGDYLSPGLPDSLYCGVKVIGLVP